MPDTTASAGATSASAGATSPSAEAAASDQSESESSGGRFMGSGQFRHAQVLLPVSLRLCPTALPNRWIAQDVQTALNDL